jgi:hypothetical protein
VEVNVLGMEDVTTPAGTFKTFKLVSVEGSYRRREYVQTTSTYFYSPDAKCIVKSFSTNDRDDATLLMELIKFTPRS